MPGSLTLFSGLGQLGGALTETWDMIRLWRSRGLRIQFVGDSPLSLEWRDLLAKWDCAILEVGEQGMLASPAGTVVVGFCSSQFLEIAPQLKQQGCRLIWVNCMTWLFAREREIYSKAGTFDNYVFQSEFQRSELERNLAPFGYLPEQGVLIRGAFRLEDWPFEPTTRDANDEFVVGRLARPDVGKWSRATWQTYGKIAHPRRRACVMGVDDMVKQWLGPAPDWAEVLPPCAIASHDFYRRIHCLIPINYSALESWPRVGLEAMAMGVPIVAPRQGGWVDMIRHGENGFLGNNADEIAEYATLLAHDEELRQRIARQARHILEAELANPNEIWEGWRKLLRIP